MPETSGAVLEKPVVQPKVESVQPPSNRASEKTGDRSWFARLSGALGRSPRMADIATANVSSSIGTETAIAALAEPGAAQVSAEVTASAQAKQAAEATDTPKTETQKVTAESEEGQKAEEMVQVINGAMDRMSKQLDAALSALNPGSLATADNPPSVDDFHGNADLMRKVAQYRELRRGFDALNAAVPDGEKRQGRLSVFADTTLAKANDKLQTVFREPALNRIDISPILTFLDDEFKAGKAPADETYPFLSREMKKLSPNCLPGQYADMRKGAVQFPNIASLQRQSAEINQVIAAEAARIAADPLRQHTEFSTQEENDKANLADAENQFQKAVFFMVPSSAEHRHRLAEIKRSPVKHQSNEVPQASSTPVVAESERAAASPVEMKAWHTAARERVGQVLSTTRWGSRLSNMIRGQRAE